MGVTAAQLKSAYDLLVALSAPVYWLQERLTDTGDLSVPDDADYYVIDHVTDPSVRDFSGEAHSITTVLVTAWAAVRGEEYALHDTAMAVLEADGWRVMSRIVLTNEVRRFGYRASLMKEH